MEVEAFGESSESDGHIRSIKGLIQEAYEILHFPLHYTVLNLNNDLIQLLVETERLDLIIV